MATCPKASSPWVTAMMHSVYDQPDATSVHTQYDKLIDTVVDKLLGVARHLEAARTDVLAFTAFPDQIWRQIWSDNPRSGSTIRAARTWSASSPITTPSSASSAPSWPSSTTQRPPLPRPRCPDPLPRHRPHRRPDIPQEVNATDQIQALSA